MTDTTLPTVGWRDNNWSLITSWPFTWPDTDDRYCYIDFESDSPDLVTRVRVTITIAAEQWSGGNVELYSIGDSVVLPLTGPSAEYSFDVVSSIEELSYVGIYVNSVPGGPVTFSAPVVVASVVEPPPPQNLLAHPGVRVENEFEPGTTSYVFFGDGSYQSSSHAVRIASIGGVFAGDKITGTVEYEILTTQDIGARVWIRTTNDTAQQIWGPGTANELSGSFPVDITLESSDPWEMYCVNSNWSSSFWDGNMGGGAGYESVVRVTVSVPPPAPPAYESEVFVYTMNRAGAVGAWSIYELPFVIDGFTHLSGGLYIRSGDDVLRVQPGELDDYAGDARAAPFSATVEWPWLDFGQPGVMKRLAGFDIVGEGVATIEVGYNQATPAFTSPFNVGPDTVPGMIIPLPIMAPSMSVRVTYQGGQKWELYAMNLYLQDGRLTA